MPAAPMTPRERLFAALNGEPTDRVPMWLLFPYHPTGYYVDVRTHPDYRPIFAASEGRAIMLNRRNPGVPLRADGQSWTGGKLATDDDLERFCRQPVETDASRIHAALDRQLPAYLAERAEFPRDAGAMMLDLGEPMGPLYFAAVLDELAVWSLTHDALIVDFLERVMIQKREVYRWCLERELAEVYFLVGSELAAPPLVRYETFRRWIVPFAKELIAMIHAGGGKAIQHFHGFVKRLLPDFVEMGADGLHTIEAPPTGNCTLTEAYAAVGDRLTLIGNIQYDAFRSLDEAGMRQAVEAVIDEARGHRFILSPTAGPFDPALPERMKRNYRAFLETGWQARWP